MSSGDHHGNDISDLSIARKHQYNNVPIAAIVILFVAIASLLVFVVVCYWARQARRRPFQNRSDDEEKGQVDSRSDTEETSEDLDHDLTIKEWNPSRATISRSRPIHLDDEQLKSSLGRMQTDSAPATMPLFPDCRGFGDFEWCDDGSTFEEDTEDDGLEVVVDLVNAGVFKRTLGILKEQPRCVLCSVCFKTGDKISVSNDPSCEHQYHPKCIREWIKTKSSACPVCRKNYAGHSRPSNAAFDA